MQFVVTRVHAIVDGITVTAVKAGDTRIVMQGIEHLGEETQKKARRRFMVMLRRFDSSKPQEQSLPLFTEKTP